MSSKKPTYDKALEKAVRAAQLSMCSRVVPDALAIRLSIAAALPEDAWRRNAGHDDPRVLALEAPYRVAPVDVPATEPDKAADAAPTATIKE